MPFKTRAKFVCTEVTKYPSIQEHVAFTPVTGDNPEDRSFWNATPSGSLNLTITNPAAIGHFKLGSAYYLDITEVEAPAGE